MFENFVGIGLEKKAEKRRDRKSKRTRQNTERGDRKEESNDSPEIPDWEGSDILGLLSGRVQAEKSTQNRKPDDWGFDGSFRDSFKPFNCCLTVV